MIYFWIFVIVVVCIMSVTVRVTLTHPYEVVIYGIKDLIKYIRFKGWRTLKTGVINCFIGLFGKGKTLSAVHYVVRKYQKYNGKKIYDFSRKKWVTQRVLILSNVELSVPCVPLTSLMQIVNVAEEMRAYDLEHDTYTVTLVLGDEFSVQLNSRSFKTNIDPLFLNTLLTCRHHHISFYYTAQRFNHVDALLRQVTSAVVNCDKLWRIMRHAQYDAFELENASDPTLVQPKRRFGWFVTDKDYNAYDTLACVGNLAKSYKEGDMLSEEEILAMQNFNGANMEVVMHPSRKIKATWKKVK